MSALQLAKKERKKEKTETERQTNGCADQWADLAIFYAPMNPIALLLPVGTDKKRKNCVEYTERTKTKTRGTEWWQERSETELSLEHNEWSEFRLRRENETEW